MASQEASVDSATAPAIKTAPNTTTAIRNAQPRILGLDSVAVGSGASGRLLEGSSMRAVLPHPGCPRKPGAETEGQGGGEKV